MTQLGTHYGENFCVLELQNETSLSFIALYAVGYYLKMFSVPEVKAPEYMHSVKSD